MLGVVSQFDPTWLDGRARATWSAAIGARWCCSRRRTAQMLGLSRLAYSLATNRQIPSARRPAAPRPLDALRRDHRSRRCSRSRSSLPADIDFLAGIFAFGAMLAFTIAHLSVIVLRFREPSAPRAFRVPLSVKVGGGSLPLPAVARAR